MRLLIHGCIGLQLAVELLKHVLLLELGLFLLVLGHLSTQLLEHGSIATEIVQAVAVAGRQGWDQPIVPLSLQMVVNA